MTDDNKITAISNTFIKWNALTDHILYQYNQALLIIIDWTIKQKKKMMRFQMFKNVIIILELCIYNVFLTNIF